MVEAFSPSLIHSTFLTRLKKTNKEIHFKLGNEFRAN
jgi:hypothetical protein